MNNIAKDKWIVIFSKNAEIKKQWMDAFQRERERVKEDMEKGRICRYFCCIISGFRAARLPGQAICTAEPLRVSISNYCN